MRNTYKRLTAGLCSAALAASMLTMTSFAADLTFEANKENVKVMGRYAIVNDNLWLADSASGVEFTCEGDSVTFNYNSPNGRTRIGVYVNDKMVVKDTFLNKGSITVDLEEGENTVKLLKLSEATSTVFCIEDIKLEGGDTVKPTPDKPYKIEFIGDSITCGYGFDDALGTAEFSTKNEDSVLAYGYQTGKLLDADVSLFSASGWGIYSGYSSGTRVTASQRIPDYYDKVSPKSGISIATPTTYLSNIEWDFSEFQPDVVVINLGTNDDSYFSHHRDEAGEFETAYIAFLGQVREKNPDAKIVCALGLMGNGMYGNIENAVDAYKTETEDENVTTFKMTAIDPKDGYAVDYHPNEISHAKAAKELAAYLASEVLDLPDLYDPEEALSLGKDLPDDFNSVLYRKHVSLSVFADSKRTVRPSDDIGISIIKDSPLISGYVNGEVEADLLPGKYTLEVSSDNYVSKTIPFTLNADGTTTVTESDLYALRIGDVTGDGKLDTKDALKVIAAAKKTTPITDEYLAKVADVTGDGAVKSDDALKVIRAAKKEISLWA